MKNLEEYISRYKQFRKGNYQCESITSTQSRQFPQQVIVKSIQNSNGMVALIFGIVGLVVIPFIASIVAII